MQLHQALFHHRWAAPILAELHASSGAKLVTLVNRLKAPRDSVQRTLAALIDEGWVRRNPGHGHPLRPEYLLTERGEALGRACAPLLAELRALASEEVGLKKWSMPVVLALREAERFSELKLALEGVTSRALTLALKDLLKLGLVERHVSQDFPPTVGYRLSAVARPLQRRLARLP